MKENSNIAVVVNSLIMYIRLAIISVCGLLYTRYGLLALGERDYGLFAVVGGIVALVAISNSIMISVSNRYIAVAIGKGDMEDANKIFNINLLIHIFIAISTILVALPITHWYIRNYINYGGNIQDVYMICDISVIASAISFVGVPFNGLLIARERFFVYCSTDVGSALLKLVVTYLLINHFEHKLLIYALTMAVMTAYPTGVFILYCKKHFAEITRFYLVRDVKAYVNVMRFSLGVGFGTLMGMIKLQGTQLLINTFFGTLVNSAIAVANTVNGMIQMFAQNISKSIVPQIYKSYAANDVARYTYLVCLSSRVTYLVMLMVSLPFLLIPDTLFALWLKTVPDGTITFSRLMIIDILIVSLNAGIVDLIFASGRIYLYQIVVNILIGISVLAGFLALRAGLSSEYLFYSYIFFSAIIFFIRPIIMLHEISFNIKALISESYLPVFYVTMLTMPLFLIKGLMNPWLLTFASMGWYLTVSFIVGLTKAEKNKISEFVHEKVNNIHI